MPNHCSNYLSVMGPSEDRKRLHEGIDPEKGLCKSYLPMPSILEGTRSPAVSNGDPIPAWADDLASGKITQAEYDEWTARRRSEYEKGQQALAETGHTDWYSWASNNWGTKWGDYDFYTTFGDDPDFSNDLASDYRFTTAWGPCAVAIQKISELFPTLVFDLTFSEEGMGFAGGIRYQNGEMLAEVEYGEDEFPSFEEDENGEYDYDKFSDELSDLMSRISDELANGGVR